MIEKLYTVEEVAELASVTGRTIRNYLKSGRLVGRKIGGQWRFPEAEVQRLLSGSPPETPRAPQAESVLDAADRQTDLHEEEYAAADSAPVYEDDTGTGSVEYADAYEYSTPDPAVAAPYSQPAPAPAMVSAAPAYTEPAVRQGQAYSQPTGYEQPPSIAAQPVGQPMAATAPVYVQPQVQPPQAPSAQAYQPQAAYPPASPPQIQPAAWPEAAPLQVEPAYARPAQPYHHPVYETPPSYTYAAQPTIPAPTPPSPSAGGYYAMQQQPAPEPAAATPPQPSAPEAPADITGSFSEVGMKVARFVADVHDSANGPVMCSVIDAYQQLATARLISERLTQLADEESAHGTLCQAFVEYDDRYYIARYTLFGTSGFLMQCLNMIG